MSHLEFGRFFGTLQLSYYQNISETPMMVRMVFEKKSNKVSESLSHFKKNFYSVIIVPNITTTYFWSLTMITETCDSFRLEELCDSLPLMAYQCLIIKAGLHEWEDFFFQWSS